ncbi:32370_t:CDS:2, partial [Racocetra persica]
KNEDVQGCNKKQKIIMPLQVIYELLNNSDNLQDNDDLQDDNEIASLGELSQSSLIIPS